MQLVKDKDITVMCSVHRIQALQRKKTGVCESSHTDQCFYKQSLQKHSERVPINGLILKYIILQHPVAFEVTHDSLFAVLNATVFFLVFMTLPTSSSPDRPMFPKCHQLYIH
jgi:hypothetical protein